MFSQYGQYSQSCGTLELPPFDNTKEAVINMQRDAVELPLEKMIGKNSKHWHTRIISAIVLKMVHFGFPVI